MTELFLETVVLRGFRVAGDNGTGLLRVGCQEAGAGMSVVIPFVCQHPSSSPAQPDMAHGPRYDANTGGTAVPRAGRLADLAGRPVSRPASLPPALGPQRLARGPICPPRLKRTGPQTARGTTPRPPPPPSPP